MKNYLFSSINVDEDDKNIKLQEITENNNENIYNKKNKYYINKGFSINKKLIEHEQPFSSKANGKRDLFKQIKPSVSSDYIISNSKEKKNVSNNINENDKQLNIIHNYKYNPNNNEKFVHKFSLKKGKINSNITSNINSNIKSNIKSIIFKQDYGNNIKAKEDDSNYDILKNNLIEDVISEDKIDSISKNCPIPSFEDRDYFYVRSIGEGSYGKIYLVEDKKTKEQFALKKVICKDYQELIKFKKEFELLYSLKNNNIMKIYKLQIKSLDLTTSCIYVLMERAQNDWNLEIRRRAIARKFYKEGEIISILKHYLY